MYVQPVSHIMQWMLFYWGEAVALWFLMITIEAPSSKVMNPCRDLLYIL